MIGTFIDHFVRDHAGHLFGSLLGEILFTPMCIDEETKVQ